MVVVLIALAGAVALTASEAARVGSKSMTDYAAFRSLYRNEHPEIEGVEVYNHRLHLFQRRREEVRQHNAQPGVTWIAAVNQFADYTDHEFRALLGHRRTGNSRSPVTSFVEVQSPAQLAQAVDWNMNLSTSAEAKDQGGCGSCWAVAAAGALETHAEIAGGHAEVSYEELVDCVENPEECGGQGGCQGATAELALGYVQKHGLGAKADYQGYQQGGDGTCKPPSNPVLTTQGFVRLPENKLQPLLEALATQGPVVVSADAGHWGFYSSGVFDNCDKDAVINHAILAMGYGTDQDLSLDYWLIRNSWGPDWGEHGHIRLLRHSDSDSYCGTDHNPLDGVGCKGGPAEMPVCGMCGVLSDSAYPTGTQVV